MIRLWCAAPSKGRHDMVDALDLQLRQDPKVEPVVRDF